MFKFNVQSGLLSVILLGVGNLSCGPERFAYLQKEEVMMDEYTAKTCRCPGDFTMRPAKDGCEKRNEVPLLRPADGKTILVGDTSESYYSFGATTVTTRGNKNWPFRGSLRGSMTTPLVRDSVNAAPPFTRFKNDFLKSRVDGEHPVSIRYSGEGEWYTKTFCLNVPKNKPYLIHAGGDNNWKVKIDGKDFASVDNRYGFLAGVFFDQDFTSGKHLVEIKYNNDGGPGALWFELMDNIPAEIEAATKESDLHIVFSSRDLVGSLWDYTGEICPAGYVYDVCSYQQNCVKLESKACL